MARTVSVPLSEPLTDLDGQTFTEVILREPKGSEYFQHSQPWTVVNRPDGSAVVIKNQDLIQTWLRLLTVKPQSIAVFNALGLADAVAVEEALLGFFTAVLGKTSPRPATPLSSPDGSSLPGNAAS